ncbi:hypothetical protein [Leifsonia xyli]|uniref:hypothetical protein n=1 Tax=Leifsonia xyli TaxID=1575 RepID=UPI00114CFFD1|nr:hypothetical protein [Leifsonia xyli]
MSTPLVIASDEAGRQVYLYTGQPVPSNVPEEEIKRLLEEEFIVSDGADEEDSFPDGTAEESDSFPDGGPSEEWTVKQLRAYAKAFDVDLGNATSKPDVLAALA